MDMPEIEGLKDYRKEDVKMYVISSITKYLIIHFPQAT